MIRGWTFGFKLNILGIDANNGIMEWRNHGFEHIPPNGFSFVASSTPVFRYSIVP